MLNINKIYFILLISLLGCIKNQPKSFFFNITTQQNPSSIKNFYEAIPYDITSDGYTDFVLFQLQMPPSANAPELPAEILLYNPRSKSFTLSTKIFPSLQTAHFRHWIDEDFNGDGYDDLFISDHGGDAPPYPGGRSKLFINDKQSGLKYTPISDLNTKLYTYHSCAADIDQNGKVDLFLNNNQKPESPPLILLNTISGWKIDDQLFFKKNSYNKFFSCSFLDVNKDGFPDLFLGRHDGTEGMKDDIILVNNHGKFSHPLEVGTYQHNSFPSWGTTESIVADFNNDKKRDLLLLLHNPGFSKGAIKIMLNQHPKKMQEMKVETSIPWNDIGDSFFIPWAETIDLNQDSFLDIIAPIRTTGAPPYLLKTKLLILINQQGKGFKQLDDPFLDQLDTVFSAWKIKNTSYFAVFTYSGKIHLLEWKR